MLLSVNFFFVTLLLFFFFLLVSALHFLSVNCLVKASLSPPVLYMDDDHDHQHGPSDLGQQLIMSSSRSHFPSNPFPVHRNLTSPTAYQSLLIGGVVPASGYVHDHYSSITAADACAGAGTTPPPPDHHHHASLYGIDQLESGGWINNNGSNDVGNSGSRWPRQETLTLLEIRSRLDSKFKETNQKGPLWDEVSRLIIF